MPISFKGDVVSQELRVYYFHDTVHRMACQLEAARFAIEAGIDRQSLQQLLPAGGARNALDCALWDLEARLTGVPAWKAAGLNSPVRLVTTFTLGADEPAQMAAGHARMRGALAIKLKLTGGPIDADRVRAVREARPEVWLGVDANQGFTRCSLDALMPVLVAARVQFIERPFRIGREAELDGLATPIPSPPLVGRFGVVNIKLDKSGGLTEALAMAREAQRLGLDVMIGNMTGTTLAMAPAFLIGQLCHVVDLDGPTFLRSDRSPGVVYDSGTVVDRSDTAVRVTQHSLDQLVTLITQQLRQA